MALIRIKHPTLDDGRVVEVSEASLPHHAAGGWVPADEPAPVPAEVPPAPATDDPEPPKRRGRTIKESD